MRVCDILGFILWIQISDWILCIHTLVNTYGSYLVQWFVSLRYFWVHVLDSDFWLNTLDSYFWLMILPGLKLWIHTLVTICGSYFIQWFASLRYFGVRALASDFWLNTLDSYFGWYFQGLILWIHTLVNAFGSYFIQFILWIQISDWILWIHAFGWYFPDLILWIHTLVNTFGSYFIHWFSSLRYFGVHTLDSYFWLNTLDSYFWLILPGFNTLDSYFG